MEALGLAAIVQTLTGAASLVESGQRAQGLQKQGMLAKEIYGRQAVYSELRAADSIKRGDQAANDQGMKTRQAIGEQKAAYAGQGIEVTGSGVESVLGDTAAFGAEDQVRIKNAAWREAFGFRSEAENLRQQGELALQAAKNNASSTAATGGLQFLNDITKAGLLLGSRGKVA